MQRFLILSTIFLLTIAAENCNEKKNKSEVYKGRFEIQGICMNYTIKLLEGNLDTSKIMSTWTDEVTNKSYSNVFGLKNPCNFPATLKQGDEFYFVLDPDTSSDCIVCMAYYPTPAKKLLIKIIEK